MKRIHLAGALACMILGLVALPAMASATPLGFIAGEYPAEIEATGVEVFTFKPSPAGCNSNYSGEMSSNSNELTVAMSAKSCASGYGKVQLAMNGCTFKLHPTTEISTNKYNGVFSIGGSECTAITIYYEFQKCTVTIGPQSGLPATYENSGAGSSVSFSKNAKNIAYTVSGASCATNGTYEDGQWSGGGSLEASHNAEQTTLQVGPVVGHGAYFEGEEFQAEQYPLWLLGEQSGSQTFTTPVSTSCTAALFGSELPSASTSLTPVEAEYSSCTVIVGGLKFKTSVNMHSCYYVLHAAGTVDIACSKEGDSIELISYKADGSTKCQTFVSPQSGLSTVGYSTIGEEHRRAIQVNASVTGVTYSTVGGILNCGAKNGTYSNGTYSGGFSLMWANYFLE